ncbi:MAG: OmpA family protein [Cytophagales bacterium]|nr:OmpA family protein [Cytophagales bacterium]
MRYFCYFIFSTIITTSRAQDVQWASKVLDFSTQYGPKQYSAKQVLGPPGKLPSHGSSPCAWAAKLDGSLNRGQVSGEERLKVGFEYAMKVRQVVIAENYNPGAVEKVFLFDIEGNKYEVYSDTVGEISERSRMFNIFFPLTDYKVKAVEINLQCGKVQGWNEIDAIGISDSVQPVIAEINVVPDLVFNSEPINLGLNINTTYQELKPVISPDGKTLFFVREGHPENLGRKTSKDDQDIWVSEMDTNGNWKPALNISVPLNNNDYNFVGSITPDGNLLLLGGVYEKARKRSLFRGYLWPKSKDYGTLSPGVSMAYKKIKGWTFPEKLKIANYYNESSYVSYYLANDAKILLMSLDRRDSYGARDLYVSFLTNNKTWTEPQNLGSGINTAADDFSPFLAADGVTMYYATEGFATYGSNDIFMTTRLDDSWQRWSVPQNLGPVINTTGNDAYYTIPASGEYAYFVKSPSPPLTPSPPESEKRGIGETEKRGRQFTDSPIHPRLPAPREGLVGGQAFTDSVRNNGGGGFRGAVGAVGAEDIYKIKLPDAIKPQPVLMIAGKVIDSKTQKPIGATVIYQIFPEGKEAGRARSHPLDGKYKIVLPVGKYYSFHAEIPGYIGVNENLHVLDGSLNYKNLPPLEIFRIGLEEGKRLIAAETYMMDDITIGRLHQQYDFNTLPSEKIYMVCLQEGEMLASVGKAFLYDKELKKIIAQFDFKNLSAYEIYRLGLVLGKKLIAEELQKLKVKRSVNWAITETAISLPRVPGADQKIFVELAADEVCKIGLKKGKLIKTSEEYVLIDKYQEFSLDLQLVPIEEGQTVRLNNIFFEYDKADLKKESFVELNRLVKFLKENETVKIEIAGHTDIIGSIDYNLALSQRRAQAVADHLIQSEISKERMLVKGYGESKIVTSDDTEEDRQLNRRVEFTILKK